MALWEAVVLIFLSWSGRVSAFGVVITGAARGVGFAYAAEFQRRGHDVLICDVDEGRIRAAGDALERRRGDSREGKVYPFACDVSVSADVASLAEKARASLGTVHLWINNAGVNGGRRPLVDVPDEEIERVVRVNLLGTLLCTKQAMKLLGGQAGVHGHIFNTVGSGVKGGGTPGFASYGATKRGLPQLTESLVAELDNGVQGIDQPATQGTVGVHTVSPGMVFTDLLLRDSTAELRKFPFGVLAAQPEEVAQDLVPKILATRGTGSRVEYLDTKRILLRFFERFVLQKQSKYISGDGEVIRRQGEEYSEDGVRLLF